MPGIDFSWTFCGHCTKGGKSVSGLTLETSIEYYTTIDWRKIKIRDLQTPYQWKSLNDITELRKSLCTWLRECCRQVKAEVVSNSRNKIYQTTYKDFFSALYTLSVPNSNFVLRWCDLNFLVSSLHKLSLSTSLLEDRLIDLVSFIFSR